MTAARVMQALVERLKPTRPLVALDLETTGTIVGLDRIVQVGVIKGYPDGRVTEWETKVDPAMAIPTEASHAHKITNDMLVGAPLWEEIAPSVAAGLTDCDILGYNAGSFDVKILKAEFDRVGVRWNPDGAKMIDGQKVYFTMFPRTLTDAVREYVPAVKIDEHGQVFYGDEHLGSTHDAKMDAILALLVVEGQLQRHTQLPQTVGELHDFCFPQRDTWVDDAGKLVWRGTDAVFTFGKLKGRKLQEADAGYLRFIINSDFSESMKRICRDALDRKFPVKGVAP